MSPLLLILILFGGIGGASGADIGRGM